MEWYEIWGKDRHGNSFLLYRGHDLQKAREVATEKTRNLMCRWINGRVEGEEVIL